MMKIDVIQGTVFFIDMRNFTLLSSYMAENPRESRIIESGQTQYQGRLEFLIQTMTHFYQDWVATLQVYIAQGVVKEVVFQSTGDGVMVGLVGDKHYQVAFESSIAIAKKIRKELDLRINPRLKELGINRWSDLLDFGVGICSGSFTFVAVPKMIDPRHSDFTKESDVSYTILGTAPNYAARVESATKDHSDSTILIAEPTIELLCKSQNVNLDDKRAIEDHFGVTYLSKHKFKGVKALGLYMVQVKSEPDK